MRKVIIVLLTSLLTMQLVGASQTADGNTIKQRIGALPSRAHVAVQLINGSTLHGRIASRGDIDFVLRVDNEAAAQTISYDHVQTVQQIQAPHSKKRVIVWVVVAAVAVLAVITIVVAVHHPVNAKI